MRKQIVAIMAALTSVLLGAVPAFAHVVVKPNEVGVAAFQTFTIGVPNEKDSPVVNLRLLIPDGLKSVSPNVKPGWTVEVKKTGDGEDAKVTEIDWTGGSIPAEQRDDFVFSAQVPANETTLQWKAYQTYQNGDIVSWDQAPVKNMTDDQREEMEKKGMGPYSETKVVNDLKSTAATNDTQLANEVKKLTYLSELSFALAAVALAFALQKKRN
jgi:uncharacterized protein YcnI